jgi:Protein of unknown function (DUF2975)
VKTRQVQMKMLAKILKNVSNILFWIVAAIGGIFLLASLIVLFIPGKDMSISPNLSGSIATSIGGSMIVKANLETLGAIFIKPFLQAVFLWIVVLSLMVSFILYELKLILKNMVDDRVFEKSNSKNLTLMAVALMSGAFIVKLFEYRLTSTVIQTLQIVKIKVYYLPDWTLLLVGILILILAAVFKYGSYLQEEVDSTL